MRDFTEILGENREFNTTSWTLVRSVKDMQALNDLISIYWKPLYFFVRKRGYDNETGKDIVQEFLATLLERDALSKADPERGRFRTFLLTALVNFIKDWSKGESRQKRGGGRNILSLDFAADESEYRIEAKSAETPEAVLHRTWARSLWKHALSQLEGDATHLEAFRMYLADVDYAQIAEKTGLSEGAAKTAVHRLKGRLREILVGHLSRTAASEAELGVEIEEFMTLLASGSK